MQEDEGKQKADTDEERDSDLDEGDPEQALPELPRLVDMGPPIVRYCRKDDLFWNSVMREEDTPPPGEERMRDRKVEKYPYYRVEEPSRPARRKNEELVELEAKEARNVQDSVPQTRKGKEKADVPLGSSPKPRERSHYLETAFPSNSTAKGPTTSDAVHLSQESTPSPPPLPPRPAYHSSKLRTGSSQTTTTPRTSKDFDESVLLPVDRSMYIYRNEEGQRRLVLPSTPQQHLAMSEPSHPFWRRSPSPQPSPHREQSTGLTWNVALNRILEHELVDPAMKEGVRERIKESKRQNGDSMDRFVSAVDVGLVPNFSYPIAGSAFYDRLLTERLQQPQQEELENAYRPRTGFTVEGEPPPYEATPDIQGGSGDWPLPNQPLPNGVPPRSSSPASSLNTTYSDPTHARPSGLATTPEVALYRLLSSPSPRCSPLTTISHHERTIATQTKLIRKLHKNFDKLREKNEYLIERNIALEDEVLPKVAGWLEQAQWKVGELEVVVAGLKEEGEAVWECLAWVEGVLRSCWKREREVMGLMRGMRESVQAQGLAQGQANGLLRRLFGGRTSSQISLGPTTEGQHTHAAGSTPRGSPRAASRSSLLNSELDTLAAMTERNLKSLRGNIEEMDRMIKHCALLREKVRQFERSTKDDEPRAEGWRDV